MTRASTHEKALMASPARVWMDPTAAAEYVYGNPRKAKTLEFLRITGDGPRFSKAGPRRVLYKRAWLDEWLENRSATSTAEAKAAGLDSR